MCRPESSQFSLGPPLIPVHALSDLSDLLNIWHTASDSESPLSPSLRKEDTDEAIGEASPLTDGLSLLPVRDRPVGSDGRQKALTLALMELLINATHETLDAPAHGGEDNNDASETHA